MDAIEDKLSIIEEELDSDDEEDAEELVSFKRQLTPKKGAIKSFKKKTKLT